MVDHIQPGDVTVGDEENWEVTLEDVDWAISRVNSDSAGGPDGVIVRAVKVKGVSEILKKIFERMIKLGSVVKCLKKARTVLIDKGGSIDEIKKSVDRIQAPDVVKKIVIDCQMGNESKFEIGLDKSTNIQIKRGLMQGAPLSPLLYNVATNHLIEELTEQGESIAEYVVALRKLSEYCQFNDELSNAMRDQLVWGVVDPNIKRKLLADEGKLSFPECEIGNIY
ncbi:hypothetical protein M8J76_006458 [Diaphorina citri]|nr:hypothetical protein M8J76_006458 [Diaphorina citri]